MKKSRYLKNILFLSFALIWTLPIWVVILSSFRPFQEIRRGWWNFSGANFSFTNFIKAWHEGVSDYYQNTFVLSVFASLLPLAVGILAAFAITKFRFRGKKIIFGLYLMGMLLPVQLILIPLLPMLVDLDLHNRILGLVLVHAAFGMGWTIFHFSNFFSEVPDALLESAQMDGANHFQILSRIIFPLSLPSIVSYLVLQFIWVWNDLLLAFVLIQSPEKYPITVGLINLQSPFYPEWGVLAAGSVLAIIPPILLFLVFQLFYREEMLKGAVK